MALSDLVRRLTPGRSTTGAVRAVWNGTVLAESDRTILLEGNHYFPRECVRHEHLVPSAHTSRCPWKGEASYATIVVGGERRENGAWSYRDPSLPADKIKDHVAFAGDVTIERA